jgi:sortase A
MIVTCTVYLAFAPFLPEITFLMARKTQPNHPPARRMSEPQAPSYHRLIIPAIGVDAQVHEGESATEVLKKGLWRRPHTSTPDKGGNTVIVAHRFLYTSGTNTFYHLPKIRIGDQVSLWWKGKLHSYTVTETMTVDSDHAEIEAESTSPQLTLYTCTPLWTSAKRFVVVAKPT